MKQRLFLFPLLVFLFSQSANALVYLNAYGGIGFGDLQEVEEVTGGTTLTHDGWTANIGVGARAGVSIGLLKAGLVGEFSKVQWEGEREDGSIANAFDGAEDYDNVLDRTLFGAFFIFSPPVIPVSIIAEYYSSVSGSFSYAEGKGENIFAQDDEINGNGYGLGIALGTFPAQSSIIVRNFVFDEFTLNGVTTELPSNTYKSSQKAWEIMFQAGVAFDL
jgi:hypothetical protein